MLFLAFLPQFVDPQAGTIVIQLVVLATVYACIAFSSDIMVAMLSGKLGKWLVQHQIFFPISRAFFWQRTHFTWRVYCLPGIFD
ncbi:MAG: threonine/homoserine/homoserine lactone efflux protein [Paraglaciecola sp.]